MRFRMWSAMAQGRARALRLVMAGGLLVLAACGGDEGGNPMAGLDFAPRGGSGARAAEGGAGQTQVVYFDDAGQAQSVPRGIQPMGEGYTVNLQGVSVDVAAKSLLTDTLGASYELAPGVDGTVTLATGGAVPRDKLLQIFETALQADGLILTKSALGYVISPGGDGVTAAMTSEGYGLSALPLHHVGAKRMLTLLDGFAVPQGTIRAADSDDMLLVRGTSADRAAVTDLVNALDSGMMAKPNAGIAFLQNASAASVASELGALGDSEPAASGWRVQVLDRSNALLVMARGPSDLTTAMKWIRRLDQTGAAEGGDVQVYQVQYGKATDLARLLTATFGGDAPAAQAPDEMQAVAAVEGGATLNDFAAPTGAGADAGTLAAPASGPVRFTPNDGANTIIIRAPTPTRRQALSLLASLDRAPVQVLIDVMLIEVTLNDATRLGVQAYLEGGGAKGTLATGNSSALSGSYPGFNLTLGRGISPKLVIDDLSQVTKVKVVSAPSVVAFENEQAEIKVVEQVPIVTQEVTQNAAPDAPTVNTVEYRDAGVILRVTPQVSQNNLVNLQVQQELSAVVGDTANGTSTLTPTLRQRSITTHVAAYDRQTIVLGGLISQESSRARSKFLGIIPNMARNSGGRSELLVFITPHVVRNGQDAAAAGAELRAKMTMMAGQ